MSSKELEETTHDSVITSFSTPRMIPFLTAAQGNKEKALELYAWNAQMAGAALEQISHLEVLLRNAIDTQLSRRAQESERGIPWFLLPPYNKVQPEAIDTARQRLRPLGRETRDQIIAGLSFGYWSGWVGSKYEELWRQSLRLAFPHGSGQRKEVSALVEQVRKFRNRIAHHDSLLNVDIGFEMIAVFTLAEIINEAAAQWMRSVDRTREVGADKPISITDTVVVAASEAWPFYLNSYAYICQAGRYFQDVKYLAFYADQEIKTHVANIKNRYDNVVWNEREAERLLHSESREDRKLGKVMHEGLASGWTHGKYQVFLLSRPTDPAHILLSHSIVNTRRGRGSAFTQRQRYTSVHQLRHAENIEQL